MTDSPLRRLPDFGQSPWLDFIQLAVLRRSAVEIYEALARDTAGTIAEGRRLWAALDRPNAMIKAPGTTECLDAIRALLVDGVNVYMDIHQNINRMIYEQFAAEGIEFAYPTRTLFVTHASPATA